MVSGYHKHPPEDDGTPKLGPIISFILFWMLPACFAYAVIVTLFGG
jgi:hypothetical protein